MVCVWPSLPDNLVPTDMFPPVWGMLRRRCLDTFNFSFKQEGEFGCRSRTTWFAKIYCERKMECWISIIVAVPPAPR